MVYVQDFKIISNLLSRSDVADADDIFPKLSQYLQLASNQQSESKKSGNISPKIEIKIKQSPPSTPATPTPVSSPISIATPTVTSSAPVVMKPATQPSKISLVPTNILMKPNSTPLPQSSLNFSPQLFCAKSASGTQTVYTTTSNGGQMPMKLLLVNALQTPKRLPTQTPPLLLPKTVTSTSTKLTTTATGIADNKVINKPSENVNRNGIGSNVHLSKSFVHSRDHRNESRGKCSLDIILFVRESWQKCYKYFDLMV